MGNCWGPDISLAGVRSGEAWADHEGDAADMYHCGRLYSRKVSVPPLHSVNEVGEKFVTGRRFAP